MEDLKKIFSQNLKTLMFKKELKQKDLVKMFSDSGMDIKQQNISNWINGKSYPRDSKIVNILCNYFNCSYNDLFSKDISSQSTTPPHPDLLAVRRVKFPVLGEIACGKPIFMNEDKDCFVMADSRIDTDYCLIARGDSMQDVGIKNGDLVFIKTCDMVRDGEIAVVSIDDEATLKRVRFDRVKNEITLISENPKYSPMIYKGEELEHIHILGKAVFYQSFLN